MTRLALALLLAGCSTQVPTDITCDCRAEAEVFVAAFSAEVPDFDPAAPLIVVRHADGADVDDGREGRQDGLTHGGHAIEINSARAGCHELGHAHLMRGGDGDPLHEDRAIFDEPGVPSDGTSAEARCKAAL